MNEILKVLDYIEDYIRKNLPPDDPETTKILKLIEEARKEVRKQKNKEKIILWTTNVGKELIKWYFYTQL